MATDFSKILDKIAADNTFRAATEVHIFLMIATSLVLRGTWFKWQV